MPVPPPDLLDLTAQLVEIPSVSHSEQEITAFIERRLEEVDDLEVIRVGENLIARTHGAHDQRLLLAGHTDTVPAAGNEHATIEADMLWGLGSADMKGGLAVMLALAEDGPPRGLDVTYVFYAREEVASHHSGILEIIDHDAALLEADAAVLGEPTGGAVEAGCQGTMRIEVTLDGKRAHTARPWMGENAVHRLGQVLTAIAGYEARQPEIDGCCYHEALQAVSVQGGVAGNVVPDRAGIVINHRFAPDRTPEEAERSVRALLDRELRDGDTFVRVEVAPAAAPELAAPLLASLINGNNLEVRAKLGWTDVARLASLGVPAANFGPGASEVAHAPDERVTRQALDGSYLALRRLLDAPVA